MQKVIRHSSQMETLRCIGLDQKAVDNAIDGMHRMIQTIGFTFQGAGNTKGFLAYRFQAHK